LKLNNLSLDTKMTFFVLFALILAMSLMLFFSLHFYEKRLKEDVQQDFKSISSAIISAKLYTLENIDEIKNRLSQESRWCFSSCRPILMYSDISITKLKPPVLEDTIHFAVKADEQVWITISMSNEYIQSDYEKLMKILFVVMFSILLLTFLLIFWHIRTLTKPLRCLTNLCNDIQEQSSSVSLCQSNSYEVSQLYKAIVSLLNTNHHLCESKVDLFKEAAHELKAPLTIMQARLNLLQEDKNYDLNKYEKETTDDILMLNSKLKELLFLKEIEFDMQQEYPQEICMMEQCKKMQERFKRLMQLKQISIETNWLNTFVINTHAKVLQKVMQAIFENVFIHSRPNSVIKVEIYPKIKKMIITNELNLEDSEHTSSHIGLKIISRLSDKLNYDFHTSSTKTHFTTSITFNS